MTLDDILVEIREGTDVHKDALIPYLCHEEVRQRCKANVAVAQAYADRATPESFALARHFVERAWLLSGFSPDLLDLYLSIQKALGDVEAIRGAHRHRGLVEAAAGNIGAALAQFNLWQNAYVVHQCLDRYSYDFEILEAIERLASRHRHASHPSRADALRRRLRIAYLTFGLTHHNSVIMRIAKSLARYHDKATFELGFFAPETRSAVRDSAQGAAHLAEIASYGWPAVTAPDMDDVARRLIAVGSQIHEFRPDILVTFAGLADLEQYFIAAMRPAQTVVGMVAGPPPQFAAPSFDWTFSWSKHPLMDTPCNCSLVRLQSDVSQPAHTAAPRAEFGIPGEGPVIMSGGRHVKFQDRRYWCAMVDLLRARPDALLVTVGVEAYQLPFLDDVVPSDVRKRMILLSWTERHQELLTHADVVVDTFPSGGGMFLFDAVAAGVPVVSFRNDYFHTYDQTDWSVWEEFMPIPELLAPRGDFRAVQGVVLRLLSDGAFRDAMVRQCSDIATRRLNHPEAGAADCEAVYRKALGLPADAGTTDRDVGRS